LCAAGRAFRCSDRDSEAGFADLDAWKPDEHPASEIVQTMVSREAASIVLFMISSLLLFFNC
jgi:hypothetical protein